MNPFEKQATEDTALKPAVGKRRDRRALKAAAKAAKKSRSGGKMPAARPGTKTAKLLALLPTSKVLSIHVDQPKRIQSNSSQSIH